MHKCNSSFLVASGFRKLFLKLGRAISYTLKYQTTFENVLLYCWLELSNNKDKHAVKSLVMGRKNWSLAQSFQGTSASGIILSLIATAKRNELDPEKLVTSKATKRGDFNFEDT